MSARGPCEATARASAVSEGASATAWTTSASSRPRGRSISPGSSRRLDLVQEGRGRLGGAVLVADPVGEEELSARQRQAGVEQVALLDLGLAQRAQARGPAAGPRRGTGRCRAARRELAVLEGGDEDVVEARGTNPTGVGDPHPVLDRPSPDPDVERAQRGDDRLRGRAPGREAPPARRARSRSPPRRAPRARSRRGRPSPLRSRRPGSASAAGLAARGLAAPRPGAAAPRSARSQRRSASAAVRARACGDPARTSRPASGRRRKARAGSAAGRSARPPPSTASSRAIRAPPTAVVGDRDLGLERDRDAVGLEHRGEQRPAAARVADDDRDLLRRARPRRAACAISVADRLGLAALPGRAQEDEALVAGHAAAGPRRPKPRSRWKSSGASGVLRGFGLERLGLARPRSPRAPPAAARPAPRAPRSRPRRGARPSPRRPRRGPAAGRAGCRSGRRSRRRRPAGRHQSAPSSSSRRTALARDLVVVDAPEVVADLGVAGEQGGDVAEVGGALERPGRGFDVGGPEAGVLELAEQPLERAAGSRAGAAERAQRAAGHRRRAATAAATAPRRWAGVRLGAGRRAAGGRRRPRKRPPKVITAAPSTAPSAQSSRSKL